MARFFKMKNKKIENFIPWTFNEKEKKCILKELNGNEVFEGCLIRNKENEIIAIIPVRNENTDDADSIAQLISRAPSLLDELELALSVSISILENIDESNFYKHEDTYTFLLRHWNNVHQLNNLIKKLIK